jgi:hypothetical protein
MPDIGELGICKCTDAIHKFHEEIGCKVREVLAKDVFYCCKSHFHEHYRVKDEMRRGREKRKREKKEKRKRVEEKRGMEKNCTLIAISRPSVHRKDGLPTSSDFTTIVSYKLSYVLQNLMTKCKHITYHKISQQCIICALVLFGVFFPSVFFLWFFCFDFFFVWFLVFFLWFFFFFFFPFFFFF